MSITVREVTDKKGLKEFVDYPYRLYKDHRYFVPALRFDELATLRRDKNPAFEYCEAKYWLAYRDGEVVGRIAGIWNKAYIEKWKNNYLRFGWIDFEDDQEVVNALLAEVEDWAKANGMDAVHGPLGFTDFDKEGMLIEGFDQLGTMATNYNYPYYPLLMESAGYRKDIDWLEYKIKLPAEVPARLEKIAAVVKKRLGLQVVQAKKRKDILRYAKELFALTNSAYSQLYGVVPLTEKQIAFYTRQYFSFIQLDLVPLVVDRDGRLVAFGLALPSLSIALQKAKGSLLPVGFYHVLRALKKNRLGDLYLIAVNDALQGKGVNALVMCAMTRSFINSGFEYAESNPELESNKQVQAMWQHYDVEQHKRRRCYIKRLSR